jgi:hypothetical protein
MAFQRIRQPLLTGVRRLNTYIGEFGTRRDGGGEQQQTDQTSV